MKRLIARRPSPATVMSAIALFVALGGVSYGFATGSIDTRELKNNDVRSADLRDNSVRTEDLRNNAIRAVDIRNSTIRGRDIALNTLTGNDIAEDKLGKVPSALDADTLAGNPASAYARSASEPVRLIGAAGQPELAEGYSAAADRLPPGFWKDPFGVVHLQGSVVVGPADTIFTLPVGYRPGADTHYRVAESGSGGATLVVDELGVVSSSNADPAETLALDGVTFRATG